MNTQTCDVVVRLDDWTNLWFNYWGALHIKDIPDLAVADEAFLEWRNTFSYLLEPHVLRLDQMVEQAAAADVAGEPDARAVLEYLVVLRNGVTTWLAVDSRQQLNPEALDAGAEFRKYVVVRELCGVAGQATAPATTTAPPTLARGEQDYIEFIGIESGLGPFTDASAVFLLSQGAAMCRKMQGWADAGSSMAEFYQTYLTGAQQLLDGTQLEGADAEDVMALTVAMLASAPYDLCPELTDWANDR